MNRFKCLAIIAAVVGICFVANPSTTQAQIAVQIGPAPVCPYGYFDYAPYACAPWGYYGPNWFVNGIFIGAGPWYHGPAHFYGRVNNRFDPHHGYHGHIPARGEAARPEHPVGHVSNFRGNETRDGRGHSGASARH
jgi:hypothetical protein